MEAAKYLAQFVALKTREFVQPNKFFNSCIKQTRHSSYEAKHKSTHGEKNTNP